MEEDDDTYGFGSFSDLFDAGAARAAKRLDMGALSRFCMSERLLARFQTQQRRGRQRCELFQHVAAKFDGVGLDGGLGALCVAPLEGGGVVWLQTTQSDSDALERRAKELQDITNQPESKSAAALFVAVQQVAAVQPTTVQNTVQGVELKLQDGNRLELTFMPGPFSGLTHRDDFLEALKKLINVAGEKKEEAAATEPVHTPSGRSAGGREAALTKKELKTRKNVGAPTDRKVVRRDAAVEQKEKFRQLVRRYTRLDQMSGEGLAIAKQVHAGTGYHLGPTTTQPPKFSADSEYRKKTVAELTDFLKRMNQEWSEADTHREQHTSAKHSRNDDDLFEYTDTVTGVRIPTRTYEQRYLKYVKAHEVDPVLHMFPAPGITTNEVKSAKTTLAVQQFASGASQEEDENARRISSHFKSTLGIDISSSYIVEKDLFASGDAHAPSDAPACRGEDAEFRAEVDNARAKLWDSWGSAFNMVARNHVAQAENRNDNPKHQAQTTTEVSGHATRKRARDRRRSLILPNSNDLQSNVEADFSNSSQAFNGTPSSDGADHQQLPKRSRSTLHKSDTAQKSRRKARRQSIVSLVNLPSTVMDQDEQKTNAGKRRTPQSSHKSRRPRHPANGYARETSALEMVGDEDSDLCQLCYSESAVVHMKPCDHVVCASCWSRLSPSSGKSGSDSRRVCPWDREAVTKR